MHFGDGDVIDFIAKMPKVELHAHINGSVSLPTLQQLVDQRRGSTRSTLSQSSLNTFQQLQDECSSLQQGKLRTMDQCFAIFKLVHEISDCTESVYKVTKDVITEFANENVKYIELRTTPREVAATGMSREQNIASVLKAIKDSDQLDIIVRLLLSVDRRQGVDIARETVKLAERLMSESDGCVVGVDFSGHPGIGNAQDYFQVFKDAQQRGLKTSLHLSEVEGKNEETEAMLTLPPDRVGHGTYLHPDRGGTDEIIRLMDKHKIPLEVCLTSNMCSATVDSYAAHHMKYWYDKHHPIVICTDDKGVMATSLCNEYTIAANTFDLDKSALWRLSIESLDYTFAEPQLLTSLKDRWKNWQKTHDVSLS